MNTLKIQNRELLVKLTERNKSLESLETDLATATASRTSIARNVASFAIFMTQVCLTSLLHCQPKFTIYAHKGDFKFCKF